MAFERNDRGVPDLLKLKSSLGLIRVWIRTAAPQAQAAKQRCPQLLDVHGWSPRLYVTRWLSVALPIVLACARDP